jgi:hypothetical protein
VAGLVAVLGGGSGGQSGSSRVSREERSAIGAAPSTVAFHSGET